MPLLARREAGVLLVDERDMGWWNEQYRRRAGPTDILSFSSLPRVSARHAPRRPEGSRTPQVSSPGDLEELHRLGRQTFEDDPPNLGDMVVCPAYMERKWGQGERRGGARAPGSRDARRLQTRAWRRLMTGCSFTASCT